MAKNFEAVTPDYASIVPFTNNLGSDLGEGVGIDITTGTVVAMADGATAGISGVTTGPVTDGSRGAIFTRGVFSINAAAAYNAAMGALVYAASASTVDAGSGGDTSIGRVVREDPAASARLHIHLQSNLTTLTTQ